MLKYCIGASLLFMLPALCMEKQEKQEKQITIDDFAEAVAVHHEDVVQGWLKLAHSGQIDVNQLDHWGYSTLELLCIKNRPKELQEFLTLEKVRISQRALSFVCDQEKYLDVVKILMGTGKFDPNAEDANGRTPLQIAGSRGLYDIVAELKKNGGTVGATDPWGLSELLFK